MYKKSLFFGWGVLGCLNTTLYAQNLQYNFQLTPTSTQLTLDFPVQTSDVLQGRDGSGDFRLDVYVKANVPQSTLQVFAQAGRYNMTINCANNKCIIDAPNLDKKVDLHGTEITETISAKLVAPAGITGTGKQSFAAGSGVLPSNLKVRIVLEGTQQNNSNNWGILPPAPDVLKGDKTANTIE